MADDHRYPAMIKRVLVVFLLFATALALPQAPASDSRIMVRAGRLFDGKSDNLTPKQVVIIHNGRTLTSLANPPKDLMVDFTTLHDLKALGAMHSDVDLRNAIDHGSVQGPRMQVSTRGIQAAGGFLMNDYSSSVQVPIALQVVDSPWAPRPAVSEQSAHGTERPDCMLAASTVGRYRFAPSLNLIKWSANETA